ncbi:hypothetical protein [Paracoccus sp. (in: a-proteobacteria)]|uniref:hypothetical protein n=1 Tax=Paracoccus sp. TaxID=267 RepID=UPI0028B0271C|nr:hypothetical protein [Paracoccus sp. (in: a-proteobacteria)]
MNDKLKVGMRVHVNIPDKTELPAEGILMTELRPGDCSRLFQVELGEYDGWSLAE